MVFVFERDVPCEPFLAAFHMFADLLDFEPQSLYLLHFKKYISQFEITSIIMLSPYFITLALIVSLAYPSPEPVYTIHYLRSYRNDLLQTNLGCGKSIVFGTYLYPLGPVDALYVLINGHQVGVSSSCNRPATYIKLFGDAQDYSKIGPSMYNQLDSVINRGTVIIDWKHMLDGPARQKAYKDLESLIVHLKSKGTRFILKAPASFFCAKVAEKRFILDQPADEFIIELYGEEPGRYTTYDSIFGQKGAGFEDGYTSECPKYPTRAILNRQAGGRKVYFQKTLDPTLPGFIGPFWQLFLQQAGESESSNTYFYDSYPHQTVDF